MKNVFFTVGPSQLYKTVAKDLQKAIDKNIGSISHRGKEFSELYEKTQEALKKLLNIPAEYSVFFISSGNEGMERIIENCVERQSLHIITGSFSQKFFEFAKELGKHPASITADEGSGISFNEIKVPSGTELICFTQNETSTGVWIPEATIAKIKKTNPHILVAVDVVSSLPYVHLDFRLTDCVFFSVQKLFGLPAGLGVMIVSPAAIKKSLELQKKGVNIGTYHSFPVLKKSADKFQTPETPSVLHIFLLHGVLQAMLKKGIIDIRKDADNKASLLYDFFDNSNWKPFIKLKQFRSPTVVVVETGSDTQALKILLKNNGLIVGSGYGKYKNTQLRIANFPAITQKHVKELLTALRNFDKQKS